MFARLRNIDLETDCWIEEDYFQFENQNIVNPILGVKELEPGSVYELDKIEFMKLADKFGLKFRSEICIGELAISERKFAVQPDSHTGRELLLMLEGRKPLAVFSEEYPKRTHVESIPESRFRKYVESGKLIMAEHVFSSKRKEKISIRRVMYSIPEESWRIKSYIMLWELEERYGWNPGFEKIEGYLLGYEIIDDFYRNDKDSTQPPYIENDMST